MIFRSSGQLRHYMNELKCMDDSFYNVEPHGWDVMMCPVCGHQQFREIAEAGCSGEVRDENLVSHICGCKEHLLVRRYNHYGDCWEAPVLPDGREVRAFELDGDTFYMDDCIDCPFTDYVTIDRYTEDERCESYCKHPMRECIITGVGEYDRMCDGEIRFPERCPLKALPQTLNAKKED